MKKLLMFILVSILGIMGFSYAQESCDQTFYGTLRYYKGYIFNDTFNAGASSYYLWNYRVDYKEQYDYNNSSDFPIFGWTDAIKAQNYEVKKGQDLKFIEAKTPYYIYSVPATRAKDNLFLKYTVTYSTDVAGTNKKDHTECKYYEISRCGDGVIDSSYGETCDDGKDNGKAGKCKLDCSGTENQPKVDLSLTKDVNKSVVQSGETVVFTITVKNDGAVTATNVAVADSLPNGYVYVSNTTSQGSYNSSNGIWTIGTINKGESKILTLTAIVKNSGDYKNIAEVSACTEPDIDSTPNNHIPTEDDQDDAIVTLTSQNTEIDIEKKLVNNIVYQSGDLVTFRMDFVNKGPGIAHHVVITDYLPRGMTYVSSTIKMDDGTIIPTFNRTTENNVDTIKYFGFDLNVNRGGYIILTGISKGVERISETTNNVFIKSDEDDDHSRAKFDIYNPTTVLTIDKTINKSIFSLGEIVYFSIAVKNNGPTTINSLQIGDIRPDTNCIVPSGIRRSDHQLTMTNPNTPYAWTYNQTFNIGETINLYITGQVKNDNNCIKNYLNTGTLTYNILGQQRYLRDVVPFSVVGENNQCKSIFVSNTAIKLDSNYQGSTDVVCTTDGTVGNIQIDCGNGKTSSINGATSLSYKCDYTEPSYPKYYTISCKVNNTASANCSQPISLTKSGGGGGGGYCGNGRLDSFESCDITDKERAYEGKKYDGKYFVIGDRADNGRHNISSKYDDGKYYCKNCGLKEMEGQERYTPPACFNTQTTISVQKGEYLPFRWNLEDKSNIIDGDDCDDGDDGKILKDTLECTFKVYNGKHSDSEEDYVYMKTKNCDIDERDNKKLFQYFENSNIYRSLDDAFGKYYFKVDDFAKDGIYGEYKLALDSVKYEYCDEENERKGTVVERVCEVDFAVTKPYIAQKSAFNITPRSTNIKLRDFLDIVGNELIKKTDLEKIMILDEGEYNASSNVYSLMTNFIKKYDKLAVKIDKTLVSSMIESNSSVQVSKVPNQQIYIFQGNGDLRLKELSNTSKPFTMIIKGLNLVVKGDITKTNGMFLVDGGTISFEESETNRCKKTQTVQGIFVSNKGFTANNSIYQSTANDDLNNPRCVYGGLKVKGVLIGNNIESVILARRSQLNDWFRVNSSNDSAVKIERRNEIFNGASLLIEYSPSLREQLPPGANEFTKSLEVYKK